MHFIHLSLPSSLLLVRLLSIILPVVLISGGEAEIMEQQGSGRRMRRGVVAEKKPSGEIDLPSCQRHDVIKAPPPPPHTPTHTHSYHVMLRT